MPSSSERLKRLPPYIFVELTRRIQEVSASGGEVIRLDIGNPDMPPPQHVIDCLSDSANQPDQHGYSGYRGIASFRQAVAAHYAKRFGVTLNPETEVLPLIGSKEGIVNLCLAYLDTGDYALVPAIGYPSYAMATRLAGAEPIYLSMSPTDDYRIQPDQIDTRIAQQAKLFWVNYPNNPTGAVVDVHYYQELVTFCLEHDLLLASDNPYVEITYDGHQAVSALQAENAKACTVEFMSFSKAYNMAGWRLGAAVGNSEALRNLLHVKSNMDSGHFKAVYAAGINALKHTSDEWIQDRNKKYQDRRDRLHAILPDIGLSARLPKGAMYIWAQVLKGDDQLYIREALTHAHVALAPGSAYGPGGEGYVRLSIGVPDDKLDTAIERLKQWYQE